MPKRWRARSSPNLKKGPLELDQTNDALNRKDSGVVGSPPPPTRIQQYHLNTGLYKLLQKDELKCFNGWRTVFQSWNTKSSKIERMTMFLLAPEALVC